MADTGPYNYSSINVDKYTAGKYRALGSYHGANDDFTLRMSRKRFYIIVYVIVFLALLALGLDLGLYYGVFKKPGSKACAETKDTTRSAQTTSEFGQSTTKCGQTTTDSVQTINTFIQTTTGPLITKSGPAETTTTTKSATSETKAVSYEVGHRLDQQYSLDRPTSSEYDNLKIDEENLKVSDSFLLDDPSTGRCVWYDQCGPGFNPDTFLNCPATNKTRHGPYMKSPRGLEILKRYCPNIYKGNDNTRTCCSESQLITFESSLILQQQILSKCPNCWTNWLNFFCQIACGLNQADFMWPDMKAKYPYGYHYTPKGIPAVTVVVATQYAEGFFNSCKDVQFLHRHDKAISMFCGTAAKYCNASTLLNYMGNIGNGRAAFFSHFLLQTHNWTSPDNTTLIPLNETVIPCNASSKTRPACACSDCPESCSGHCIPQHTWDFGLSAQRDVFHTSLRPPIRRSQLVITRPWNHTKIKHYYPPPSYGYTNFTSLFGLDFLHKVLELQTNITSLKVSHSGGDFNFTDICFKPAAPENEHCGIEGVLQYWQNNKTKLDEVIWDEYQIFYLADHFDHFLSCANNPYATNDYTKLNMSCRADYDGVMKPMNILASYDGMNYQNATAFVISFYLNTTDDDKSAKADEWYKEVDRYLRTCPFPDMMFYLWP